MAQPSHAQIALAAVRVDQFTTRGQGDVVEWQVLRTAPPKQ